MLREWPGVDAIVALAPETSALSALERPLHRLAALLDSLPPVLEVRYAEADTVTDPLAGQTASKAASLSFWIKTTQVGSNIGWDSPSVIGMENNGGTVDVQWGFINNQGKIGFGMGDNAGLMSNNAINDNQWHSVTISHDFTTGRTYMWVDGVAQAFNGTIPFDEINNIV